MGAFPILRNFHLFPGIHAIPSAQPRSLSKTSLLLLVLPDANFWPHCGGFEIKQLILGDKLLYMQYKYHGLN